MFQLNLFFRYEMTTEGIFELVPMDIFRVNMSCYVSGPPVSCYASQLMSSIEYLLSVRTLRYHNLLSTTFNQSSASKGSRACENSGGLVLRKSRSLDWGGGGGGGACWFCWRLFTAATNPCRICIVAN